jgi:PPM family protein phosphatase
MIQAYGKSDIGRKRQRNEDSFAVNSDAQLFIVADGMGGHNAGDVASSTAVRTIESYMVRTYQERELSWPFGIDPKFSFDGDRIRTADANQEYTGMGTTVVSIVVRDDVAVVASVGDSRAYLVRGNQLAVLTRDDVWLNETWVRKAFTEDQLARLPLKNVLSKAIGSKEDIDFPVQEFQLQDEDILFLCSDGLHGLVSSEDLLTISRENNNNLQALCDTMIDVANEAGGKDNITIVALKYTK